MNFTLMGNITKLILRDGFKKHRYEIVLYIIGHRAIMKYLSRSAKLYGKVIERSKDEDQRNTTNGQVVRKP